MGNILGAVPVPWVVAVGEGGEGEGRGGEGRTAHVRACVCVRACTRRLTCPLLPVACNANTKTNTASAECCRWPVVGSNTKEIDIKPTDAQPEALRSVANNLKSNFAHRLRSVVS